MRCLILSDEVLASVENPGKYHKVDKSNHSFSACNNHFGYDVEIISKEEAEERGLEPCLNGRCYGDEQ